jgi:GNAT superfamily N-acetyltransferase
MAGNIYDDALDALDEQQVGPEQDPFEAAVGRIHDSREQRLRASLLQRDKVEPDRAAEAMKLSRETGLPARLVEANFDRVKKEADNGRTPYEAMFAETPALAEWASTPENAQVAADDMEQLGALEWLVSAPGRAFSQGVNQVRFATLRHESLFRELSRSELDLLDSYRVHMQEGGELGAGSSWFRKAVTGGSQQLPNLFGASLYAARYGVAGAAATGAVGAGVGALAGGVGAVPGAVAAAPFGARAGAIYGAGKFGFVIESGLALDEFLAFKDETGQTLDPAVARVAALSAGAMAAGFEAVGFEALAKTIPGLDKLTSVGARAAVKRALRQPSIRAAMAEAVKTYGTTLTVETATEVAQRGVTIMAGEIAKAAADQNIPSRTGADIVEDLTNEGIGALEGFGLLSAAGPAMGAARAQRQIQQGEASAQFFKALGGQAAASATVKRMPEAAQAFLERAMKDGPIGTVYAPAEQWVNYWQSQGVDPAEIARDVTGSSEALALALATGEDLAIPTARYAVTLAATEHNQFFAEELRLSPGEMNGRESREFRAQLDAEAAAEQQAAVDAVATPAQQVRMAVLDQLVAAGVERSTAESYADLYESTFGSLAERAGVDPFEMLADVGLTVDRPALEQPTERAAAPATGDPVGEQSGKTPPAAPAPLPLTDEDAPTFGDEVPGMAALEAASAGATIEPVLGEGDQGVTEVNASGESGASFEAMSRLEGMKARGEQFGVFDRAGKFTPVLGADAVDYQPRKGQTFGIAGPSGFQVLTANGGRVVDKNLPARQDGGADGGRSGEAQGAGASRDAGEAGAPTSSERSGAGAVGGAGASVEPLGPYANAERLGIYADALDAARSLDPNVDERLFRAEFDHRLDIFDDIKGIQAEESPVVLLKRIAATGGIFEAEGGQAGEMRRLREGQAFGKVGGVPGVLAVKPRKRTAVRKKIDGKWEIRYELRGGLPLDVLLQDLQAEGRWPWLQEISDLIAFIEDVQVNGIPEALGAVPTAEDLRGIGIDVSRDWWNDVNRQAVNLLDVDDMERDMLDPHGPVDTSFNVADFAQSLFDALDEPGDTVALTKADTLDTGEQQARLPGAVGDVRDEERPTPKLSNIEDEFRLTSEVDKRKGVQRTLFQSAWHGSPHKFDEFSLHAIGSGEGHQAYGWGLYFASRREVAEHYRNVLTGGRFTVDGDTFNISEFANDYVKDKADKSIDSPEWRGAYAAASDWVRTGHPWGNPDVTPTEVSIMTHEARRKGARYLVALGEAAERLFRAKKADGRLFEVDLPDEDYLDWDKPASQQSPKVQEALKALGVTWKPMAYKTPKQWLRWADSKVFDRLWREDIGIRRSLRDGLELANAAVESGDVAAFNRWQEKHPGYGGPGIIDPRGELIYQQLKVTIADSKPRRGDYSQRDAAREVSLALSAQGINGIRYLDGASRSTGEGSFNFVVFDDKLVQVREFFQSGQQLDDAAVKAFAAGVQERAGADLAAFDLRLDTRRPNEPNGVIVLDTIAVRRGASRAGLGTKVMRELTRFADVNAVRIELTLADKGDRVGGPESEVTSSRSRLLKFYTALGFTANAGRYKDFSTSASMYREPTVIPSRPQPLSVKQPRGRTVEPGPKAIEAFNVWFRQSKVVDPDGQPLPVYHGTRRKDRVGTRFRKARATSEPMAFFTDTQDVARRYSEQKADTSLEQPASYAEWFKVKIDGKGREVHLGQAWWMLSQEQRAMVIERLPTVGYTNHDQAEGPIINGSESIASADHIAHILKEQRGNGLMAAVDLWLDSGSLFNDEEQFLDVLKGLGLDGWRFDSPWAENPGVFEVYLSIQNPLDVSSIPNEVMESLKAVAKRQRKPKHSAGADAWDKRTKDPKDWIATLERDITSVDEAAKVTLFGNSMAWTSIPDWVTDTIKAFGYDGIKDTGGKMGGDTHVVWIPFEEEQVKSARGNRGTFDPSRPDIMFQGNDQRALRRGAIRFGPGRQVRISLFEKADLSTFLHESGHLFLELMGDLADRIKATDPASRTAQQQGLVSDYDTLLEWLAVSDRSGIDTPQHERFAEAFEVYLGSGEAPSLRLQAAFSRFRAWLLGVYRSLSKIGVAFSPEVKAVVDRLVAGDVAIAQANDLRNAPPMFITAEAAGMTPTEFALYENTIATANRTAREQLDRRLMAEVQREQTKQWKDRRNEVEAGVAAEVYAEPVYKALAAMQRGTNPDGSPMVEGLDTEPLKLSRAVLVARYGADYLKRLPRPYVYSADGGLDPDFVATMFGFDSGDALLKAVEDAAPMREVIRTRTEQRMLAEHGSLLLDGGLHDAAQAAISNEDRDAIVRAELRALGKLRRVVAPFQRQADQQLNEERAERAYERRWLEAEARLRVAIAEGTKDVEIEQLRDEVMNLRRKARGGAATINAAVPSHQVITAAAKARIAGMKLRQIRPDVFWHASRRAAQQALDRAARQDLDGAIESKRKELLNLALYREAQRVLEDVDARVKFARGLARPTTRASIGLAGHNYLDQIDGILDRFEFAQVSQKALDRRASLVKFIEGLESQGLPTDMPEELLNEALRTNYQNLTAEQLVGVTDGLKALVHLARLKNRLLKAAQQRELDATADEIATSIRDNFKGTPATAGERDRRLSTERLRGVQDFVASHRKIASLVREMDGFADAGPMWEAIVRPLNDAGAREAEMNAQAAKGFQALVEAAFPSSADKRALYEKTLVPSVGKSLSKMERLGIALNWGNESNRDRVRRSEKWTDEQVNGILATLNESDFRFVQGVFDLIGGYWSDIAAKQERVYGIAPEKVEAAPIRTAFGEFAGGYFPLKYDERLSPRAGAFVDVEEAGLARAAAYAQSTTKRGHTKARVEGVKLPVRRDFGVMFEHVRQVIHDLSHHETLIDVGRVLAHPTVQAAIYETHGDVVYKQLKNGVRDIAIGDVPATGSFERAINHIRVGATIAGLGWNVTTALLQPLGLTQSMVRIGPKWVARGMSRWLRDAATMENTAAWVRERSTFMRERGRTQQREINEIRNAVGVNTGRFSGWVDDVLKGVSGGVATRQGMADSYFFLIQQAQLIADLPTWLGQYEKAMEGGADEASAIAQADSAVLDSQGGGQVKDLAGIQRGGPMLRLWTNFYSFFNVTYNLAAESTRRTNFRKPGDIGRLMVDYLLLYSVPALLGYALREAIKPDSDEDDDENLALELAREQAAYIMGTMVITRELSGVVGGGYGYEGPAGARAFSSASRLVQQVEQGEPDAAFWRSLNDTAGAVFHYPAGQTKRTIEGFAALVEGKTSNPFALIAGAPK